MTPVSFTVYFFVIAILGLLKYALEKDDKTDAKSPASSKLAILGKQSSTLALTNGVIPGECGVAHLGALHSETKHAPDVLTCVDNALRQARTDTEVSTPDPFIGPTTMALVDDEIATALTAEQTDRFDEFFEHFATPSKLDMDPSDWIQTEHILNEWD